MTYLQRVKSCKYISSYGGCTQCGLWFLWLYCNRHFKQPVNSREPEYKDHLHGSNLTLLVEHVLKFCFLMWKQAATKQKPPRLNFGIIWHYCDYLTRFKKVPSKATDDIIQLFSHTNMFKLKQGSCLPWTRPAMLLLAATKFPAAAKFLFVHTFWQRQCWA